MYKDHIVIGILTESGEASIMMWADEVSCKRFMEHYADDKRFSKMRLVHIDQKLNILKGIYSTQNT